MTNDDRKIVRRARIATWFALPATALLVRLSPAAARSVTAIAIGTIGVGHGANDDAVLHRMLPRFPGGRPAISIAYAAVTLGVIAAALRAPSTADRMLSLLTWYHFGSGDISFARAADGGKGLFFEGIVRGAVPLCGPGTERKKITAGVAAATVLVHLICGDLANALDVALPAGVVLTASVPLGFASYFGLWHAPRHLALMLARDGSSDTVMRRLLRFARESARNVGLAIALGALVFARTRKIDPRQTLIALTLGMTIPHQVAVWSAARHSD